MRKAKPLRVARAAGRITPIVRHVQSAYVLSNGHRSGPAQVIVASTSVRMDADMEIIFMDAMAVV